MIRYDAVIWLVPWLAAGIALPGWRRAGNRGSMVCTPVIRADFIATVFIGTVFIFPEAAHGDRPGN
jgi:hypothetical protein